MLLANNKIEASDRQYLVIRYNTIVLERAITD